MTSDISSFLSLDDIRYTCEKIFGVLKTPIYFFNENNEAIFEFAYEYSRNPLYADRKQTLTELLNTNKRSFLNLKSTQYYENYLSIQVTTTDSFNGTLLIGPTLSSEIDEKSITSLIKEFNISVKYKNSLVNYYKHVVILDVNSLVDIGLLLYYSVYHSKLDVIDLSNSSQIFINTNSKNENAFDISESKKRRDAIFHHSPGYERELLECIKQGDVDKLNNFLKSITVDGELGFHSKNPLRNQKNLFISFASLVSHAAFEGGLDWELALTLSDFYIRAVEENTTIVDISNLFVKMFLDYTERVHKVKIGNYSTSVLKSQNFIFEHLYEKISLAQIAKHISINPSYISHLFKKEVGISISEYIQEKRIDEAKKLIESDEKSFADIYVPLGFIDQSHFTKVFKKITGITPKKYRTLYVSSKK